MKLRTLIVDDEPIALAKLRGYVNKTPYLELAGECTSSVEAAEILARGDIDVLFTDINMPDLSGMELMGVLGRRTLVVFTTAYAEYAVESYRHSAVDYLLKPYSFAGFQRAAARVLERSSATQPAEAPADNDADSLFVKVDYRYIRVRLDDIRYIKGYGEYLQIYVTGQVNPLLTLSSFASIRERLTSQFLQIHRSYIVNMNRISHIERARVVMDADTYLPVGDSYKNALQNYLAAHAIGGKRE